MRLFAIILFSFLLFFSCSNNLEFDEATNTTSEKKTITFATLNKYSSFFTKKGDTLGFEYELAKKFAQSIGAKYSFIVVNSQDELISLLDNNNIDIIAYPITIYNSNKENFKFVGNRRITKQKLIQRNITRQKKILDVTELKNKTITLTENSKYQNRFINLNNELGNCLNEELSTKNDEELIKLVAEKKIDYTFADEYLANYYSKKYKNLNTDIPVSLNQKMAWIANPNLEDSIYSILDNWLNTFASSADYKYLEKKYFNYEGLAKSGARPEYINSTTICNYDKLFKKYSPILGWDWRLLAAIAYQETKFDNTQESYRGAKGLMQLMPNTAFAYGADSITILDPETNIRAAVQYIKSVDRIFSNINEEERFKFVLASYNAGVGHVKDAIALTEKYGKDACLWEDNVADYLVLKSNELYYNDPVVKHGKLRGADVCKFVNDILVRYHLYCDIIK